MTLHVVFGTGQVGASVATQLAEAGIPVRADAQLAVLARGEDDIGTAEVGEARRIVAGDGAGWQ